jgi:hypothetical protein
MSFVNSINVGQRGIIFIVLFWMVTFACIKFGIRNV